MPTIHLKARAPPPLGVSGWSTKCGCLFLWRPGTDCGSIFLLSEALYNFGDTLVGGGRLSLLSRLPTFRSQAPFVFTLSPPKAKGWAPLGPKGATVRHTGRERRGTGRERNSPAALECQASRSPAAARLMAPARSQEQPGASSLPGERKRLPAASAPSPSAGFQKPSLRLPFFARAWAQKPPFPPEHPQSPFP